MDAKNKKYKILLTGGGTAGSVSPLLAVAEELKREENKFDFFWLGTKYGPEQIMVEEAGIKFKAISGGKWRRYFSWQNLIDIFKIKFGFWQALVILLKSRPDLVISAGSFVSVPVVWAAWLLGVKVLVHQQDTRPGLANRLMAPFTQVITVCFESSLKDYGKKAVWIGNPTRITNYELRITNYKKYNLNENLPVILVIGGGTGAQSINQLVWQSLSELTKFCQIIHLVGKDKRIKNQESRIKNYNVYEFLDVGQMAEAYRLADIVVSRCGLGTLSELSYLGKPSIIIPIPDSHQEDNAAIFSQNQAAIVLQQQDLSGNKFVREIKNLVSNKALQEKLSKNINQVMKRGANEAMVEIIWKILK